MISYLCLSSYFFSKCLWENALPTIWCFLSLKSLNIILPGTGDRPPILRSQGEEEGRKEGRKERDRRLLLPSASCCTDVCWESCDRGEDGWVHLSHTLSFSSPIPLPSHPFTLTCTDQNAVLVILPLTLPVFCIWDPTSVHLAVKH